jgi:large-conductance mechanosensitive channel
VKPICETSSRLKVLGVLKNFVMRGSKVGIETGFVIRFSFGVDVKSFADGLIVGMFGSDVEDLIAMDKIKFILVI